MNWAFLAVPFLKNTGPGAECLHSAILLEEMAARGARGPGFHLHSEIVIPCNLRYESEAQKCSWLPKRVCGQAIGKIAMFATSGASGLQGIKTQALMDGNELVIKGQKVFITNGQMWDLIALACKTDPSKGKNELV